MKLCEIINRLEAEFPPDGAYEWDNVGLLVGDKNGDIKKVLITLDITEESVKEAIAKDADLLLSHHPIMFSPVNKITADTELGRVIIGAIENKINIYAAHTNCDVAKGGINAYLAELFKLKEAEVLEENGLGRIGNLTNEIDVKDFCEVVKSKLNTPCVRMSGDIKKKIKRVAIGSGSCGSSIPVAIEKGADVMVTGDIKYHDALTFSQEGIVVIDAGHYPTEIVVTEIFENVLKDCGVEIEKYTPGDVFKFI